MTNNSKAANKADYFLDITADVCPMTFVRTKLLLEKLTPGQTAEIRLKGAEPLSNVPRSVQEIGDTIVSMEPEPDEGPEGIHRLIICRGS